MSQLLFIQRGNKERRWGREAEVGVTDASFEAKTKTRPQLAALAAVLRVNGVTSN